MCTCMTQMISTTKTARTRIYVHTSYKTEVAHELDGPCMVQDLNNVIQRMLTKDSMKEWKGSDYILGYNHSPSLLLPYNPIKGE